VIGRRKAGSVELEHKRPDSHVASTDQDRFGKIFRRNMPYGTVSDQGTMFVGFSAAQGPLAAMLESMAGHGGGTRDALTRYTRPLSDAYYVVPSDRGTAAGERTAVVAVAFIPSRARRAAPICRGRARPRPGAATTR
jgi:putative iron-dependent peroxidase